MGKFGGNGERRKKRRRGRKVMSSNKGELSQLITFPAKPEEGTKEASNGAKHLGQFRDGRKGSNLASLHGSQGSLCKDCTNNADARFREIDRRSRYAYCGSTWHMTIFLMASVFLLSNKI